MDTTSPPITAAEDADPLAVALKAVAGLNDADLARAARAQSATGGRLADAVLSLGLASDREVAGALGHQYGCEVLASSDFPERPILPDAMSAAFLRTHHLLPIEVQGTGLMLCLADPGNEFAQKAVAMATGLAVHPVVAARSDIEAALDRLYGASAEAAPPPVPVSADDDAERLRDIASEAPIIRLVNQILSRAMEAGASDIHIEPYKNDLVVRFRIDGVLQDADKPPAAQAAAVLSRFKIMAGMDIAERRLAQDGRIQTIISGREIDFRVSTVPTLYGESMVLRILSRDAVDLSFPALGLETQAEARLRDMLSHRHGIFLVTGATGSGKTTTLYTALSLLNDLDRKIITVEDPIEYNLDRVTQIQVRPEIELTFAKVLRSIVRQDPDVIMVGEMRDTETADIAVQAALTGHLVLSTLHTNDAIGAVTRLLDMGIDDYLLTSTVNGVLSQRLVRRLCAHCREPFTPSEAMIARFGLDQLTDGTPPTLYRAAGCKKCQRRGYQGRAGLFELVTMSPALRDMVLQRAPVAEMARQAQAEGTQTLLQDGLAKALAGVTTLEEISRVTRVS